MDYEALARYYAQQAGIDPERFVRQMRRESGLDPGAYNRTSGASGIAQIVPRWHPGVNVWDAGASLQYAANLMRGYLDRFGSWADALAAYNAGPSGNWDNPETRGYVADILGPAPLGGDGAAAPPAPAPSPEGCLTGAAGAAGTAAALLWVLLSGGGG
jgi:soluble lytic murein transglycosylase-like protein